MEESVCRVLVVDDYLSWRSLICSMLHKQSNLMVVAEVSDGCEAVRQAQQLQPDLILLDIGLPSVNGIDAARQISQLAPNAKIIFLTQNRDREVVETAFRNGARAYLVKLDVSRELVPAIEAVLRGEKFVGAGLGLSPDTERRTAKEFACDSIGARNNPGFAG